MSQQVILVDEEDREIGVCDKTRAHAEGRLHRAFSVFLFNTAGEWLLQKRTENKYHSGGLWSNTCCSHPRPGESVLEAARRRLEQELGLGADLHEAFTFVYKTQFPNDLYEHELDHVLFGRYDGDPVADPSEVADWRWVPPKQLQEEIAKTPERFTYWFRHTYPRVRLDAAKV